VPFHTTETPLTTGRKQRGRLASLAVHPWSLCRSITFASEQVAKVIETAQLHLWTRISNRAYSAQIETTSRKQETGTYNFFIDTIYEI